MTLDCDKYRVNLPRITDLTKDLTETERTRAIGSLSASTNVPVIVICHYLGEIYGFSPEIEEYIATLKTFYNVTDVINARRGGFVCHKCGKLDHAAEQHECEGD